MHKSVSVFWSRWIKFLSFVLIVYGLAMIFAPQMMNHSLIGPVLFQDNETLRRAFVSMVEPEATFLNVLNGLLGTVTIGWAIQMAWIAHQPFRKGETWAWNALAMSLAVWATLEFYFKLTDGITGIGLFAHLGLLVAFVIPLLATYRYSHRLVMINTNETVHSERA